ncbi:MAG: lysophospholipid acyltransferase family protein [Chloroflexota bacterium]|nr:lysophospholipid acyltransferase family protein [Chloroflexota bacterium]
MDTKYQAEFIYPRRRLGRELLRWLLQGIFSLIMDLEIVGVENFPTEGPLLLVANHFSFIDPALMARTAPWPLEFIGGFEMPNAPPIVRGLPKLWGYYPVHRGTSSRYAFRAAQSIMAQRGVLGIFPEGGNWATVLRPARPGTAFIAAQTGARILPLGFAGLVNVFPRLQRGKRAKVVARVGRPFGPFKVEGRGRRRREQLEEIGHTIMGRIAELIPPEQRGHYSTDPAIRAAAQGTEIFPWDAEPER